MKEVEIKEAVNVMLIAIQKKNREITFNPLASIIPEIGDKLAVLGKIEEIKDLENLLGSSSKI